MATLNIPDKNETINIPLGEPLTININADCTVCYDGNPTDFFEDFLSKGDKNSGDKGGTHKSIKRGCFGYNAVPKGSPCIPDKCARENGINGPHTITVS
jgi:hypothetical protein